MIVITALKNFLNVYVTSFFSYYLKLLTPWAKDWEEYELFQSSLLTFFDSMLTIIYFNPDWPMLCGLLLLQLFIYECDLMALHLLFDDLTPIYLWKYFVVFIKPNEYQFISP